MATFVLTDATIALGGVDLTSRSNQVTLTYDVETQDNTVFGMRTRSNAPGLWVVSAEVGGFTDEDLGNGVFSKVGGGPDVFALTPTGADGAKGYAFRSMATSHQPVGGSVGEMAATSLNLSGRSGHPLVSGTILHPADTARTATGTGTARQLGDVAAGESVYAALNVLEVSGTAPTLDVTVSSDDASGFATPTTQLTFDQVTDVGGQWKTAAGPLTDTWWRVSYTIGGTAPSFRFQVVVGIR
ncbi:MAG: hypothetical protein M3O70_08890 [Actinomycetota bacterium]|nr:hypothetical protein [Actinomycetota bacterium]